MNNENKRNHIIATKNKIIQTIYATTKIICILFLYLSLKTYLFPCSGIVNYYCKMNYKIGKVKTSFLQGHIKRIVYVYVANLSEECTSFFVYETTGNKCHYMNQISFYFF